MEWPLPRAAPSGRLAPVVIVCPDAATIAARALDLVVDALLAACRQRGVAHLALTGGSSAAALFGRITEDARARHVDWSQVHLWQGDERFVPLAHDDSNWAVALREWLDRDGAPFVPPANRHPIPVEAAMATDGDAESAARAYGEEMARTLPRRDGLPAFDVWLLGVGSDGHLLSAFPGGAAVNQGDRPGAALALGVPAPTHIEPHLPRVTLSPHLLAAASMLVVMVPGAAKAAIVARCFREPRDPGRLPAQAAVRPNAVWLLEEASAAELR